MDLKELCWTNDDVDSGECGHFSAVSAAPPRKRALLVAFKQTPALLRMSNGWLLRRCVFDECTFLSQSGSCFCPPGTEARGPNTV